jgi:hypothetical protein
MKARSKSDPLVQDQSLGTFWDATTNELVGYYPTVVALRERGLSGFDIPDFHKRRAKGELLPYTPFTQFELEGAATGVYDNTYVPTGHRQYMKDNYVFFNEWQMTSGDAITIANAYLDEAAEMVNASAAAIYTQGWDALTFIAELKKTVLMFKETIRRFVRIYKRVSYSKNKDFASLWLEGRYGWRPLIYDIIEIDKALRKFDTQRKRYKQNVGRSINELVDSYEVYEDRSTNTATYLVETRVSASVRGSIVADIQPPRIRFDPAKTAWELIPYSFVIDWFVQVGQFVDALNFLRLSKQYRAAAGVYATVERTMVRTDFSQAGNYSTIREMSGKTTCTVTRREPQSVQLSPTVNLNFDWLKAADSLALLRNLVN